MRRRNTFCAMRRQRQVNVASPFADTLQKDVKKPCFRRKGIYSRGVLSTVMLVYQRLISLANLGDLPIQVTYIWEHH